MSLHIILDLDHTLIVHNENTFDIKPDVVHEYGNMYFRPYMLEFLESCLKKFASVSIWTAAKKIWLNLFLEQLPDKIWKKFRFVWHQDHTTRRLHHKQYVHSFAKDLDKVFDTFFDMNRENTYLVDDTYMVAPKHVHQTLQVSKFEGDPEDRELHAMLVTLEILDEIFEEKEEEKEEAKKEEKAKKKKKKRKMKRKKSNSSKTTKTT